MCFIVFLFTIKEEGEAMLKFLFFKRRGVWIIGEKMKKRVDSLGF
mgnify:CR=1 FL=1